MTWCERVLHPKIPPLAILGWGFRLFPEAEGVAKAVCIPHIIFLHSRCERCRKEDRIPSREDPAPRIPLLRCGPAFDQRSGIRPADGAVERPGGGASRTRHT